MHSLTRHWPSMQAPCILPESRPALGALENWRKPADPSDPSGVNCASGDRVCVLSQVPMVMHIDLPPPLHERTLILGEPVLQRRTGVCRVAGLVDVGLGDVVGGRWQNNHGSERMIWVIYSRPSNEGIATSSSLLLVVMPLLLVSMYL